MLRSRANVSWLGAVVLIATALGDAAAQLPAARLFTVFPPGARKGTSVDVTIGGEDLDAVDRLVFSHPGITAEAKMRDPGPHADVLKKSPRPVPGQFRITVDAAVPVGLYEVRAAGRFGLSNPRFFQVGAVEEALEKEPNDAPVEAAALVLGTTVSGRSDRTGDVDRYRFTARKGQRILADCFAWRTDSQLSAVLAVHDAAGLELARDRVDMRRDPLLDFTAPEDGDYVLEVRDLLYRGGGEYFYRLHAGSGPRVDSIFPPAGAPGSRSEYTLLGRNLPGGSPVPGFEVGGMLLEELRVEIAIPPDGAGEMPATSLLECRDAGIDAIEYRLEDAGLSSNAVRIALASAPVASEAEPNDLPEQATKVGAPCEVAGRFYPRGDRDWFAFRAEKGAVYWLELVSQRLGAVTDAALVIQRVKVEGEGEAARETMVEIAYQDDGIGDAGVPHFRTSSNDPIYRFSAPETASYRVEVRDLYGRASADPRNVYVLRIRAETPDFRLIALSSYPQPEGRNSAPAVWNPFLRQGGTEEIQVIALRRDGFDGPIELAVEGLPEKVRHPTTVLGPGRASTLLVLEAAEDAEEWLGRVTVAGTARIGDQEVRRVARAGTVVWPGRPSRFARDLALAASGVEKAPLRVEAVADGGVVTVRSGKLELPVRIARGEDVRGKVTVEGVGLPPNAELKNVTLDEKATEGKMELQVKGNAPVGEFTFHLRARAEIEYRRRPEAVEAARKRKEEIDTIASSLESAAKDAEARLAEAKAGAEKAEAELQQVVAANAGKTAEEVAAATVEKTRARDEALATVQAAEQALGAAREQVEAAKAAQKEAAEELEARDKEAKPKKLKLDAVSTGVPFTIAAAAVALGDGENALPAEVALRQGSTLELPVAVRRLYGFADAVRLEIVLPKGLEGVRAEKVELAKESAQGVLKLEAAANAALGRHGAELRASIRFNGQDQTASAPLAIVVEAVPEPTPQEAAP